MTTVRTLPGSFGPGTVAISPDGRLGLCGGGNEPVRLWELATGALLRDLGADGSGSAGVAVPGQWVLASGDGTFMRCTVTGRVSRFDTLNPLGQHPSAQSRVLDDTSGTHAHVRPRGGLSVAHRPQVTQTSPRPPTRHGRRSPPTGGSGVPRMPRTPCGEDVAKGGEGEGQ